jgi:hypothetical protein
MFSPIPKVRKYITFLRRLNDKCFNVMITECMDLRQYMSEQMLQVLHCVLGSCQWEGLGADINPLAVTAINYCLNQPRQDLSKSPLFSLLCDVSLASARKNSTR